MTSLKKQAINSIIWTAIRTVVTVLTGPLLLIVQARFLTPREFGILSVINIYLSIINVIENFGFSTAIIQKDEITKDEKSSLFIFQVAFVTLLGVVVIVTAPLIANFFNMPDLKSLLPLLSLVIFLNGPAILFTAFLEKDFFFKELSIINILRQISLFIFTYLFLANDYALVGIIWGQIISVSIMVILIVGISYTKDYLHLQFHFKISDIKPYIYFGASIGGKQLMTQLTHHLDELIIGYFLSAETLGLYHFAKNLLNRIRTLVSTSFSKVLLPLLSKVKYDLELQTKTYNYVSKIVGVIAFPMFVGVALTADLFIPVFFGVEWLDSTIFFVILSISYIPYMLTANIATSLLYSINKPNWVLYTDVIVNISYILLLLIFSNNGYGIYTIVGLYAIYLIVKTSILQLLAQRNLISTFKNYISLFKNTIKATLIMTISIVIVKYLTMNLNIITYRLIIAVFIGIVSYVVSYYIIDRKTVIQIKELLINR